jgi:hypothetical protein
MRAEISEQSTLDKAREGTAQLREQAAALRSATERTLHDLVEMMENSHNGQSSA